MLNGLSADRDFNCDAAVIGAGFSGTLTAVHLVRISGGTVSVALTEKKQRFARGVAHATENLDHPLNPGRKDGGLRKGSRTFLALVSRASCRPEPAGVEAGFGNAALAYEI
jgi:glycine/D-amino acid oxidase-like deaminating enzyme